MLSFICNNHVAVPLGQSEPSVQDSVVHSALTVLTLLVVSDQGFGDGLTDGWEETHTLRKNKQTHA